MSQIPHDLLLFSHSVVSDSLWPQGLQHTRLACLSPSPRVCSDSSIQLMMPSKHLVLCWASPAFKLSQHQGLFQWVGFSHQVAKVLSEHQSFQWILRVDFLRTDWFDLFAVQGTLKSSPTQFKSINSLALSLLDSPTLTSVVDYTYICLQKDVFVF